MSDQESQGNETFASLVQKLAHLMKQRADEQELTLKTVSECDEELEALRIVQEQVHRRMAIASRKRNTFATINNLPTELLANILDLTVGTGSSAECDLLPALALVCHLWYSIVNSTPTLWTTIKFGRSRSMTRLISALEKSGNAPIDVYFDEWDCNCDLFLDAIFPHSDRWRTLSLCLAGDADGLQEMSTLTAPILEDLFLRTIEDYMWVEHPMYIFGGKAPPQLRNVRLHATPVIWSPTLLCHLTSLSISNISHFGPSVDQLLQVLSACPDLKTLFITRVDFTLDAGTRRPNVIQMPALQELDLVSLIPSIINSLLAGVAAPNCKSGRLSCQVEEPPLEILFAPNITHFFNLIRSDRDYMPTNGEIWWRWNRIRLDWSGGWNITLDTEDFIVAKEAFLWLSSATNSRQQGTTIPLTLSLSGDDRVVLEQILTEAVDMEALVHVRLEFEDPLVTLTRLLGARSSADGGHNWEFLSLNHVHVEADIDTDDLETVAQLVCQRQAAAKIQNDARYPKPIRKLFLGSICSTLQSRRTLEFKSVHWPNRLDRVRAALGPEGELIWYGYAVSLDGTLGTSLVY